MTSTVACPHQWSVAGSGALGVCTFGRAGTTNRKFWRFDGPVRPAPADPERS